MLRATSGKFCMFVSDFVKIKKPETTLGLGPHVKFKKNRNLKDYSCGTHHIFFRGIVFEF